MNGITEEKLKELDGLFAKSSLTVISTHSHPDGDAVGSSTALLRYLRSRGVDVRIVLPDPCPESISFAIPPDISELVTDDTAEAAGIIAGADLLVSVDYNGPGRADALEKPIRGCRARKVLIDHHLCPETGFYDLVFSETEVSSSCELLYRILLGMPDIDGSAQRLGVPAGTALLLGMTTDSNNFGNSTYPSTLQMAGELIAAGVDRDALLRRLYNCYRENRYRLMGYFLNEKMRITEQGVAYAVLTSEEMRRFDIREGETEGFVNIPLGIGKVRLSILVKEDKDRIRVSLRSKPGTSANLCAKLHFHGGGHELAAGGRLTVPEDFAGIEDAAEYVEKRTAEFFRKDR